MTTVVVSRRLVRAIGEQAANDLAEKFRDYASGKSGYGLYFGKDKPFAGPALARKNKLQHVHLRTPEQVDRWSRLWYSDADQDRFTSDAMLVYGQTTEVSRHPYILLTLFSEEGHRQMDDDELMNAVAKAFEEEAYDYSIKLPGDHWVIAR